MIPDIQILPLRAHGERQVLEVRIRGAFDPENAELIATEVRSHFEEIPAHGLLVFDGSELTFMNSKSIGYLITWHLELQTRGAEVVLVAFQPQVIDALQTTGVTQIMRHGATLDEALSSSPGTGTPPAPVVS